MYTNKLCKNIHLYSEALVYNTVDQLPLATTYFQNQPSWAAKRVYFEIKFHN